MEILEGYSRFYVNGAQGNQVAEVVFVPTDDHLSIIEHTDVDPSLRGQGVGKQLVAKAVGKICQGQREIISLYPFAKYESGNTYEYDDICAQRTGTSANWCAFLTPSTIRRIVLVGRAVDQIQEVLTPHRR